jgi:hypothetical protein
MTIHAKFRRTTRGYGYRNRYKALSSKEQVRIRKINRVLAVLLVLLKNCKEEDHIRREDLVLKIKRVIAVRLILSLDPYADKPARRPNRRRTLQSFTESECYSYFRFRKRDLEELIPLLKFDQTVILDNGIKMSGEEVILRGLYELTTSETQESIASHHFGREYSAQSRAFKYFIIKMYENFHNLVNNNLLWWFRNGFFARSAEAIGHKMNIEGNLVTCFIDCNCEATSRVGGGPSEEGANAARWSELIQRAFYNGWKSIHGLKHQTINDAFGFCWDMFGPTSLRRHDTTLLRLSDLNDRFLQLQIGQLLQYIIFGDSAYKKKSHMTSYHAAVELIEGYRIWNSKMKSVRISIEWDYGHTSALFKYTCDKEKLKVFHSSIVSKIYTVATILRNLHAGYYGGQTSNYFEVQCADNFAVNYLNQTNFDHEDWMV